MNWPESNEHGPLGDGRWASGRERPATVEAVAAVLERAGRDGLAVYPQGGRTSLDYGGQPRRPGLAVETTALDRVIDYPASDMTITVEAGLTLDRLAQVLAEHGQRLAVDAPQADRATVGGVYATNSTGPRRFGWGRPRDQIIGIAFVTAEGEVVKGGGRVVKNVAGYDFPKLLTGSMGTLGIITSLTLRVRPATEAAAIGWFPFPRAEGAAQALERLNTSATRPVAIELLNEPAAREIGASAGLPVEDWVVVVGYEDNADSVAWQGGQIQSELGPAGALIRDAEAVPLWTALRDYSTSCDGCVAMVANVRPSQVVSFASELDSGLWSVQSHAGNGIVRVQLLERYDSNGEAAHSHQGLCESLPALRARACEAGGNLILARCPTAWKDRTAVWGTPRGDWPLMERLKQALDPGALLNPGRFVGGI